MTDPLITRQTPTRVTIGGTVHTVDEHGKYHKETSDA